MKSKKPAEKLGRLFPQKSNQCFRFFIPKKLNVVFQRIDENPHFCCRLFEKLSKKIRWLAFLIRRCRCCICCYRYHWCRCDTNVSVVVVIINVAVALVVVDVVTLKIFN